MSLASQSSILGLHNYSLFAIPVGWALANAPLYWAIGYASAKVPGAYDNANPAQGWDALEDKLPADVSALGQWSLADGQQYAKIKRAVAANNNSHVNLPLFAAGLTAAHVARVDIKTLNIAALTYVTARLAYNFAYILVEDGPWSWSRTICYWTGVGTCLTLFIKAADRFSRVTW